MAFSGTVGVKPITGKTGVNGIYFHVVVFSLFASSKKDGGMFFWVPGRVKKEVVQNYYLAGTVRSSLARSLYPCLNKELITPSKAEPSS